MELRSSWTKFPLGQSRSTAPHPNLYEFVLNTSRTTGLRGSGYEPDEHCGPCVRQFGLILGPGKMVSPRRSWVRTTTRRRATSLVASHSGVVVMRATSSAHWRKVGDGARNAPLTLSLSD